MECRLEEKKAEFSTGTQPCLSVFANAVSLNMLVLSRVNGITGNVSLPDALNVHQR